MKFRLAHVSKYACVVPLICTGIMAGRACSSNYGGTHLVTDTRKMSALKFIFSIPDFGTCMQGGPVFCCCSKTDCRERVSSTIVKVVQLSA